MEAKHIEFLAKKYGHVLIKDKQSLANGKYYLKLLEHGLICDFKPSREQIDSLKTLNEPIALKNTLFTFDQAVSMDLQDKLQAQISEYILSYRFGGAFIRSRKKTPVKTQILRGITQDELKAMLTRILASPVAMRSEDIGPLSALIYTQLGKVDLTEVVNNELKVSLLSEFLAQGDHINGLSGDDLMRFVVLKYTESTLLIKSQAVLEMIRESAEELVDPQLYFDYAKELAPCFNRFKPIFLAVRKKSAKARKAINKISRMSKDMHQAIGMPRSRTFLADMHRGDYPEGLPKDFTVFDWFRILNAIAVNQAQLENDVFQIRNGKIWYQPRTQKRSKDWLKLLEKKVLTELERKLAHLKKENIKLPEHIHLGLPISEKKSIGALPFGSVISTEHQEQAMSFGIYWENSWGSQDLDLSVIDISGQRTGWGDAASYQREDIQFSGDITNAPEGAMEFFTVKKPTSFGLFVNIYSGRIGSRCKLVIGSQDKGNAQWIDDIYVGEVTNLTSRGNVLGFLNSKNQFIIYQGRLGGAHISSPKNKAVIEKALVSSWTLNRLFKSIGINFDETRPPTIDLSYNTLGFDKLAQMCQADYKTEVA